ncbi:MAG: DUF2520 domain-containing protein, partial [Alistipes sp.]|nr:DUF2520 domain-containing protein [Alistipes sp.]
AVDFAEIPILVEASDEGLGEELAATARTLSRTVVAADSALRARAHLAAVFVSNFANHMYALGERLLGEAGLPFDLLRPLLAETARKALDAPSATEVQTGPAVRGDRPTQERHEAMLADEALRRLYSTISESIWQTSRKR